MKITDIPKREKFKSRIKEEIRILNIEIDEMRDRKTFNSYNYNRDIIGEATATSELEDEVKEIIFNSLSESYEDEIIKLNTERIKFLKDRLKKYVKQIN